MSEFLTSASMIVRTLSRRQFVRRTAEAAVYREDHSDQPPCILFMTDVSTAMPKRTVQNLIVHTGKAEVNKQTALLWLNIGRQESSFGLFATVKLLDLSYST